MTTKYIEQDVKYTKNTPIFCPMDRNLNGVLENVLVCVQVSSILGHDILSTNIIIQH